MFAGGGGMRAQGATRGVESPAGWRSEPRSSCWPMWSAASRPPTWRSGDGGALPVGDRRLPAAAGAGRGRPDPGDLAARTWSCSSARSWRHRSPAMPSWAPFRESARRTAPARECRSRTCCTPTGSAGRMGWQAIPEDEATREERPALLDAARAADGATSTCVSSWWPRPISTSASTWSRRRSGGLRDLFDALSGEAPRVPPPLLELAERLDFPIADSYRPFAGTLPGGAAYEHADVAQRLRRRGVLALTEGDRVSGLAPLDSDERLGEGEAPSSLVEPTARAARRGGPRRAATAGGAAPPAGGIERHAGSPTPSWRSCSSARSPRLGRGGARARALGPLEEYARKRGGRT